MIDLADNPNLAMLEIAAQMLGDLCDSLVFVGGCATGLLVTTVRSHQIRATEELISAPVFIATKLEAFKGRGDGDFLLSHDLEDIVTVVDGRPALADEVRRAPREIREYLAQELGTLTKSDRFLDALAGHLPGDIASQARLPTLIQRVRELASAAAT